jgi:hypothetical protein
MLELSRFLQSYMSVLVYPGHREFFHVCCTDADIIHMDDDVSSTDADSSPDDWARLTKL